MNFQFLKLSHIQRIDAPRLNDAGINMDSYTRFVPFGYATTCSEERISNISNMRRCNIASQWGVRMVSLLAVLLYVSIFPSRLPAQSVYPGQHDEKMKVPVAVPLKAECFDLRDIRLLPGRIRDNLERDSAWMVSIPVGKLLHSFRNNAGVFAGLEGGYESVKKLGGWESLDCDLRGHTTGHFLSACGLMYAATGAEVFKASPATALSPDLLRCSWLSAEDTSVPSPSN